MNTIVKLLLLAVFLLLVESVSAQTGVLVVVSRPKGPPTLTDTVNVNSYVCLDTTVVSFVVQVSTNGIMREYVQNGNCFVIPEGTKPGAVIYVDRIVSEPQPGVRVRLPPRKFYVR